MYTNQIKDKDVDEIKEITMENPVMKKIYFITTHEWKIQYFYKDIHLKQGTCFSGLKYAKEKAHEIISYFEINKDSHLVIKIHYEATKDPYFFKKKCNWRTGYSDYVQLDGHEKYLYQIESETVTDKVIWQSDKDIIWENTVLSGDE